MKNEIWNAYLNSLLGICAMSPNYGKNPKNTKCSFWSLLDQKYWFGTVYDSYKEVLFMLSLNTLLLMYSVPWSEALIRLLHPSRRHWCHTQISGALTGRFYILSAVVIHKCWKIEVIILDMVMPICLESHCCSTSLAQDKASGIDHKVL